MLSKSDFYETYALIDFELSSVIDGVVVLTGYSGECDVIFIYVDSTSHMNSMILFKRHGINSDEHYINLSQVEVSEAYIINESGEKRNIYSY